MGLCRFCNRPAGLLRYAHVECEQKHAEGLRLIREEFQKAIGEPSYAETAKEKIASISADHFVSPSEITQIFSDAWLSYVKQALSGQMATTITAWEKLKTIKTVFNITLTKSGEMQLITLLQGVVRKILVEGIKSKNNPNEVQEKLLLFRNDLPAEKWKDVVISSWEEAVDTFLSDKLLDDEEEKILIEYANHFNLSQRELDRNGAFSRLVKSGVLKDLCQGKIPKRVEVEGSLPFNFQKSEQLIWVFKYVKYYEDKKRREYVGGHQGASIRIAKGIYYRFGSFKGYPVERVERTYIGTGILAVTNRHLYFKCPEKAFRIRLDKIVMIEPYSDGVVIQRDAQTALPQAFVTGDGWFTYNLLINLQKIA